MSKGRHRVAAPIFRDFMKEALQGMRRPRPFPASRPGIGGEVAGRLEERAIRFPWHTGRHLRKAFKAWHRAGRSPTAAPSQDEKARPGNRCPNNPAAAVLR